MTRGTDAALISRVGASNFLQVETVALRQRAVGRLILKSEGLAEIESEIRGKGLFYLRAPFYYKPSESPVAGTSHAGSFVPREGEGTRAVIYFGMTGTLVDGAMYAECAGDHDLLGRLFGYPHCCASSFNGKACAERPDHLPRTVLDVGPFRAEMNPGITWIRRTPQLLFHFPCSPRCAPSYELLLRRDTLARRWFKYDPLAMLGNGTLLYGPKVGISLVTRSKRLTATTHLVLAVDNAPGFPTPVRRGSVLEVVDVHNFFCDGVSLGGADAFVATYTE